MSLRDMAGLWILFEKFHIQIPVVPSLTGFSTAASINEDSFSLKAHSDFLYTV